MYGQGIPAYRPFVLSRTHWEGYSSAFDYIEQANGWHAAEHDKEEHGRPSCWCPSSMDLIRCCLHLTLNCKTCMGHHSHTKQQSNAPGLDQGDNFPNTCGSAADAKHMQLPCLRRCEGYAIYYWSYSIQPDLMKATMRRMSAQALLMLMWETHSRAVTHLIRCSSKVNPPKIP